MSELVKGLSLRQPWAWLVVQGHKPLENRPWNTKYRGAFIVQASSQMTESDYVAAVAVAAAIDPNIVIPAREDLPRGCIVGRASIVDVIPPCMPPLKVAKTIRAAIRQPVEVERARLLEQVTTLKCQHRWHFPAQFGFVLADAVAFEKTTPTIGALSFFGHFTIDGKRVYPNPESAA